jgi:hypothetical protein
MISAESRTTRTAIQQRAEQRLDVTLQKALNRIQVPRRLLI